MEYYSVIKKNEILPFATIWADVESILLVRWVRQRSTNTIYVITYVEYKKEADSDIENKVMATRGEREEKRGNTGAGD